MSNIENIITSETKLLSAIMREKYTVDPFQRDYKWEKKHIEQLIVDLFSAFESNFDAGHDISNVVDYNCYYLGPIVICKTGRLGSIIDGQQRITSITLLLIYLNNLQKDNPVKEDIAQLIFSRKGGKDTYNLDIESRHDILDALFRDSAFEIEEDADFSVRNIWDRYIDIKDCFPEELKTNKLPMFIEWLKENVIFVEIIAHSNENAYTIFETMNDRGLNLTPAEMLKGYVLSNIKDNDQIEEINKLWKQQSVNLTSISPQEDQEFIKAWLRSVYAETIRPSIKGATNEDFEKIGTRFHTWVKDNHKKIGLTDSDAFYFFVKGDFDFYANIYKKIISAEQIFTKGLESLYLSSEWNLANSLAYPLMMSPINKFDDEKTINLKLNAVSNYLDILCISRSLNYKSINQTAMRYSIYSLVKEIRDKSLSDLKQILKDKLIGVAEGTNNFRHFTYKYDNRKFVHYLYARINYYLENKYGNPNILFIDLLPSRKRNRFVLTPLMDYNFDDYKHLYSDDNSFVDAFQSLGNFILLPNPKAYEFNDETEVNKLKFTKGDLVLNDTLSITNALSDKYEFTPLASFSFKELKDRTQHINYIVNEIWNLENI